MFWFSVSRDSRFVKVLLLTSVCWVSTVLKWTNIYCMLCLLLENIVKSLRSLWFVEFQRGQPHKASALSRLLEVLKLETESGTWIHWSTNLKANKFSSSKENQLKRTEIKLDWMPFQLTSFTYIYWLWLVNCEHASTVLTHFSRNSTFSFLEKTTPSITKLVFYDYHAT